jgi:hypothetical protein
LHAEWDWLRANVAAFAPRAAPAILKRKQAHGVAGFEHSHLRADLVNDSGSVGSGNEWQSCTRTRWLACKLQVETIDRGCSERDDDII